MNYKVWSMSSATRAKQKEPYAVSCKTDGRSVEWSCSCPDFIFRRKKRSACKHIVHIKAHVKEQDRLQLEVMRAFESGYGFDLDEPEVMKPDLYEDDSVLEARVAKIGSTPLI